MKNYKQENRIFRTKIHSLEWAVFTLVAHPNDTITIRLIDVLKAKWQRENEDYEKGLRPMLDSEIDKFFNPPSLSIYQKLKVGFAKRVKTTFGN